MNAPLTERIDTLRLVFRRLQEFIDMAGQTQDPDFEQTIEEVSPLLASYMFLRRSGVQFSESFDAEMRDLMDSIQCTADDPDEDNPDDRFECDEAHDDCGTSPEEIAIQFYGYRRNAAGNLVPISAAELVKRADSLHSDTANKVSKARRLKDSKRLRWLRERPYDAIGALRGVDGDGMRKGARTP